MNRIRRWINRLAWRIHQATRTPPSGGEYVPQQQATQDHPESRMGVQNQ